MRLGSVILSLCLLMHGVPALAQQPCPATPAPLPAALSGWETSTDATASTTANAASAIELIPGQATDLQLAPSASLTYAVRPEKPERAGSHGGMASLQVTQAGSYRIALGSAAWIDLVMDGKSLQSRGHGHGPACSGVRKMVDFALEPGIYVVQIAGSASDKVRVLAASIPGG